MSPVDGYKVLTHDFRSPIQGGAPLWDGKESLTLPTVKVDESKSPCGAGWNFCRDLPTALRIGGLWPDGWPSIAMQVAGEGTVVVRQDKCRAERLTLLRCCAEAEIGAAIHELSVAFVPYQDEMAEAQIAWRTALCARYWHFLLAFGVGTLKS